MKRTLLTILLSSFLFPGLLTAQNGPNISFKYRCVPTSTSDYSIEILQDKFILISVEKVPDRKGRIKKVVSSSYVHSFSLQEKGMLDSIISLNKLDSILLYQERITEWGTVWEVSIERNSITYNIDLPNYNNPGLESLIRFIICLVPKNESPRFECKKCKSG